MRAILTLEGIIKKIYLLEVRDSVEIQDFFSRNASVYKSNIAGLVRCIEIIADERGYNIQEEWFKCWHMDGDLLCELKKGRLRICCFEYDEKMLLATIFIKSAQRQTEEYARAIRLKQRFDRSPSWEE